MSPDSAGGVSSSAFEFSALGSTDVDPALYGEELQAALAQARELLGEAVTAWDFEELRQNEEYREAVRHEAEHDAEYASLDARWAEFDEKQRIAEENRRIAAEEQAEADRAAEELTTAKIANAKKLIANFSKEAGSDDDEFVTGPPPLFTDETWADLEKFSPEVTEALGELSNLAGQLRSYERKMSSDEAVVLLDGIEALHRVVESLSVTTLAVFARVGTPKDYGAKTAKSLVMHRLRLSEHEAYKRTELAEELGGRVDSCGQALEPKFPLVAEGLHTGLLSVVQASTISKLLESIPNRVSAEDRLSIEELLVEHAPEVRVRDLPELFKAIMDRLDPSGDEPAEPKDRQENYVRLYPQPDGDWNMRARLDPITGGIIHGLLTSRLTAEGRENGSSASAGDGTEENAGPAIAVKGSATAHFDAPDAPMPDWAVGDAVDSDGPDGSDSASADAAGSADLDGSTASIAFADAADPAGSAGPFTAGAADGADVSADERLRTIFSDVLAGRMRDIPASDLVANPPEQRPPFGPGSEIDRTDPARMTEIHGFREDGTKVDTVEDAPSVGRQIYERFATLIAHTEMGRVASGAPFSLVVTAKADDVAHRTGHAETDAENHVPIGTAIDEGLNGSVFFHLIGDKARTMAVRTENRFANAKQATILASRDQGCTFPGCDTPPGWCDVHHCVPWSAKGKTDINNLMLVCSAHHHLIDRSGWDTRMLTDGRPAWVPPKSIDPAQRPVLHARFIARDIAETLFD